MPPQRKNGEPKEIAADSGYTGEDHISTLPDALIHDVRTCALARRWRGLWKSTHVLRLINAADRWKRDEKFIDFVNNLLLFRDRSPLHEMELTSYPCKNLEHDADEQPFRFVEMWTRYAFMCNVRVLRVRICNGSNSISQPPLLFRAPLVSRHLRILELEGVTLVEDCLEFSSCPALEELTISSAYFCTKKLSSQSLKRLIIAKADFCWFFRTRISVPCLVSLRLEVVDGRTPWLDAMPFLATSIIKLVIGCEDCCRWNHFEDCNCRRCFRASDGETRVVFRSLSNASNLELLAEYKPGIFKGYLTWFPTFSKLKTLLVDEWCLADGLRPIACFVQHAPVLERLTIQLCENSLDGIEIKGNPTEQLIPLQHLKIVEIRCVDDNDLVHKVVKILNNFGITLAQINIEKISICL